MADNYRFDMTGVELSLALKVALADRRAVRGAIFLPEMMVLYWAEPTKALPPIATFSPLPNLDADQIFGLVVAWMSTAKYPKEPDHDGDNRKGLRIFNEGWGHVNNDWAAFCGIEPVWLMYGK